jgi:hypothetical protein
MSISLYSFLKTAKRRALRWSHHPTLTHDLMLLEHERRKGEELYRRLEHERNWTI